MVPRRAPAQAAGPVSLSPHGPELIACRPSVTCAGRSRPGRSPGVPRTRRRSRSHPRRRCRARAAFANVATKRPPGLRTRATSREQLGVVGRAEAQTTSSKRRRRRQSPASATVSSSGGTVKCSSPSPPRSSTRPSISQVVVQVADRVDGRGVEPHADHLAAFRPAPRLACADVDARLERVAVRVRRRRAAGRALGCSHVLAQVLVRRGLGEPADARAFLAAGESHALGAVPRARGGGRAASSATSARGSRITVHGDYDVDGICATAVLVRALRTLGADVDWYLPSRIDDGYGLALATVERLAARGTKLLVTVDCAVTAVEEVAAARAAGLDVIVTDHHSPRADGALPDAPIVHPGLAGYPCPELCAAGVALQARPGAAGGRGRGPGAGGRGPGPRRARHGGRRGGAARREPAARAGRPARAGGHAQGGAARADGRRARGSVAGRRERDRVPARRRG